MPQTETKNNLLVTVEVMLPSAIGVVGADRLGRGGLTGYGGTDMLLKGLTGYGGLTGYWGTDRLWGSDRL